MSTAPVSSDESAIADMARDFFADRAPLQSQHELARRIHAGDAVTDARPDLVREMAELGFFAQAAPEDAGGLGLPLSTSTTICHAAGRELVPGLWLDQLMAVRLLGRYTVAATEPVVTGTRTCAIAVATPTHPLRFDASGDTVSGEFTGIRFAAAADTFVVLARDAVAVVDARADGVAVSEHDVSIDPLTNACSVVFDRVTTSTVAPVTWPERADLLQELLVLVSAWSIGAAARCASIGVEYVISREQFGRPVGSFQAIKHRAANSEIDLLHADALVRRAAVAGTNGHEARLAADHPYRAVAESVLQMHGGIGFTAEVPIHLFLKDAQAKRGWPLPVHDSHDAVRRALELDAIARVAS